MEYDKTAIGIDIGGTKAVVGIVTDKGEILASKRLELGERHDAEMLVKQFAEIAENLQQEAGVDKSKVAGIGVGFAGLLNRETGIVEIAPNIGWRNVPIADMVKEATGHNTIIENDVNAGAFAEWLFGAAKGFRNVVAIMAGTGIGGGFIMDGRIPSCAAEIGHMIFRPGGEPCGCGKAGHFEAYAGGQQIQDRFRRAVGEGRTTSALLAAGGEVENVHAGHIFSAAEDGDPLCAALWNDAELALGTLAANLAVALSPEVIVLGGGIVEKIPALVERIEEFVRNNALDGIAANIKIIRAELGENAVMIGAAALAMGLAG
ncbi:MAG: ROK family protein [Planctomycetota bacterium]|jgi:glucokinase